MINDLRIDELLEKVDSRYGLVLAGARRARQINEYTATLGLNDSLGIPGPQVHTRSQHPLSIAIEELRAGKLDVSFVAPAVEAAPAAPAAEAPTEQPGTAEAVAEEAMVEEVMVEEPGAEDAVAGPDDSEGQGAA